MIKILLPAVALMLSGSVVAQTPMKSFCNKLQSETVASINDLQWVQFGPGMSGNNKSAHWHNTDPNTMFISPNMGNSYRTTDKGATYHTILNGDEASFQTGLRGPRELMCVEFSYQNPDFGFAIDEATNGIFITADRGATWLNHTQSNSIFKGLHVACAEVDPKDENVWYVGAGEIRNWGRLLFSESFPRGTCNAKRPLPASNKGLIWKSTNKGKSWKVINRGINPEAEVESILVDPADSKVVYASTTAGFYKSTNAGASWTLSTKGLDTDVLRAFTYNYNKESKELNMYVVANPVWVADGETITDGGGGIFRSRDRGASWQNISGDIALDLSHFTGNRVVTRSFGNAAAHQFGMTPTEYYKKYPKLPTKITQRFQQIEVDPNDPDNIYLANSYANASRNNFLPGQLWRTKDGGKHWYVTVRNGVSWEKGKDLAYWKERGNPVGNNVEFRYLKDTWTARDLYDPKSANFSLFNSDGTVLHMQIAKCSFMSYDKGDTWVDIDEQYPFEGNTSVYVGAGSSNLPGHGFYQDLRMPNRVFCLGGENSLWVTCDGGDNVRKGAQAAQFHYVGKGEQSPSSYAIDPKDSTVRYVTFFRQHGRGELHRSTDSGKTWVKHGVVIPQWEVKAYSGDQPVHQLCLTIDPEQTNIMYVCVPKSQNNFVGASETGFGVHKSTDGGATWRECNAGLPKPFDVRNIALDPKDSKIIYAAAQGNNGGLFISKDRGESWTEVKSTMPISGKLGINDITFTRDGDALITAGFTTAQVDTGGLWISKDGMKKWTKIFNFPYTAQVESAYYDSNVIMISTAINKHIGAINAGTYLTKDGGKSWVKFNTDNGQSDRVNDIAIDNYVKGKYYCSTFGSGWYVAKEK